MGKRGAGRAASGFGRTFPPLASPAPVTRHGRILRGAFWLFALAFALNLLAPFVYAGSGTCSAEDQQLDALSWPLGEGELLTLDGSGDAWVDVHLDWYDGASWSDAGLASENAGDSAISSSFSGARLRCGAVTGDATWTFSRTLIAPPPIEWASVIDPDVANAAVASAVAFFTDHFSSLVLGAVAIIAIVVLPVLVVRTGLRAAIRGLLSAFGGR